MSEEYKNIELETLLEEMEKKALFIFPTDDSFQYLGIRGISIAYGP